MPWENREEADAAIVVSSEVLDRRGHSRWAITAMFVGVHGSEPRCVDYRVRVIPEKPTKLEAMKARNRIIAEMQQHAHADRHPDFLAGEVSAPTEGIPRRVFEEASQSRLLAIAREMSKRRPERFGPSVRRLLDRQARPRVGRPPVRPLGEKLAILRDVELAYADGRTLEDVAARHAMSRSAVRDLVSWARRDSVPPLFTSYGPGRRGGELTPEARALLQEGIE